MSYAKKILAVILSLCMIFSLVPMAVFAEGSVTGVGSEELSITQVVVDPVSVYDKIDGHMDTAQNSDGEEVTFFRYDAFPSHCTVYFSDGSTVDLNSQNEFYHNGHNYYLSYLDDQAENPWQPGQVYKIDCEVNIDDGSYTFGFSYDVTVEENPVKSIYMGDVYALENATGYLSQEYGENGEYLGEYFCYHLWPDEFSIVMTDGTVYNQDNFQGNITYNDRDFSLWFDSDQSFNNPWGVGDHTATAYFMGNEFTFNYYIEESPVSRVEWEPVTVIENYDGHMRPDWIYNEETGEEEYVEYWYYRTHSNNITIYLKNGEVIENNTCINWNGKDYYLESYDDQSPENIWGVGTHDVTYSIAGYNFDSYVTVVENPVVSVEADDFTILEGSNGRFNDIYDEETGEYIGQQWFYHAMPRNSFRIELKDGTVITEPWFEIYGNEYNMENNAYSLQEEEPWGLGTHTVTGNVLGFEFEYNINIIDNPIESIYVPDIDIIEGFGVHEVWDYNPETGEYIPYDRYNYYIPDNDVVITLKDGTQINSPEFEFEGCYYRIEFSDDQSFDNVWGVGSHTVTASIADVSTEFKVNIIESPVESVMVIYPDDLVLIKENERNGHFVEGYDEETGEHGQYFHYNIDPGMVRVTLKDGTEIEGNGGIEYNNNRYAVTYEDNQSLGNQLSLGENVISASIMGFDFTYTVTITEEFVSEDGFKYIETDDGIIITGNDAASGVLSVPSEINGKPVVGVASLNLYAVTGLIIPDSVVTVSYDVFTYNTEFLTEISIGSGVEFFPFYCLDYCENLNSIEISENNPFYKAVDGVVYDKGMTEILCYLPSRGLEYEIPATVENIDYFIILKQQYGINVTVAEGNPYFVTVDGVTYTTDMTAVVFASPDYSGDYVMPETVEFIYPMAFQGTNVQSVAVSPLVTVISYGAFADCDELASVELPADLIDIDFGAFRRSVSLTKIKLPEKLVNIYDHAFEGSGLLSLETPASLEFIGYKTFHDSELTNVTFSEGVCDIGPMAFAYTKIKSLVLPDSLIDLGSGAFYGCNDLESVSFGENLTYIPYEAFRYSGLKSLTLPITVDEVDELAFANTKITEVTFENPDVNLCKEVFAYSELSTYSIPENSDTIEMSLFEGTKLTSIDVSDTVTNIEYGAFRYCSNLSDISLPQTLTHIGGYAFTDTAWYMSQADGVTYLEDYILYDYKGIPAQGEVVNIPEGIRLVADYAFAEDNGITEINLPASLEYLGDFAFEKNYTLENVNVAEDNDRYYKAGLYNEVLVDRYSDPIWAPDDFEPDCDISGGSFVGEMNDNRITQKGEINFDGLVFEGRHWDHLTGSSVTIEYTEGFHIIGLDLSVLGEQYVTLYFKGSTRDVCLEVVADGDITDPEEPPVDPEEPTVKEVTVIGSPANTEYQIGEKINMEDFLFSVHYSNGETKTVGVNSAVAAVSIEVPFDSSSAGEKSIVFNIDGYTFAWDYSVIDVPEEITVTNIEFFSSPKSKEFNIGDEINMNDFGFTVYCSDGSTGTVSIEDVEILTEFDSSTAGEKCIVFAFEGFEIEWHYNILEPVDPEEPIESDAVLTVGTASAIKGDTVPVDIQITGNPGFNGLQFGVLYDTDALTLIDVDSTVSGMNVTFDNSVVFDSASVYSGNGSIATLTFEVAKDANAGDYEIQLVVMGTSNADFKEFACDTVSGNIEILDIIYGDATGDGIIDIADVVILRKYLASVDPITGESNVEVGIGADANGDGSITITDITLLRSYLANMDPITGESTTVLGPRN